MSENGSGFYRQLNQSDPVSFDPPLQADKLLTFNF